MENRRRGIELVNYNNMLRGNYLTKNELIEFWLDVINTSKLAIERTEKLRAQGCSYSVILEKNNKWRFDLGNRLINSTKIKNYRGISQLTKLASIKRKKEERNYQ